METKVGQMERKLDEIKQTNISFNWPRFEKRASICDYLFAPLEFFESHAAVIVISKVYQGRMHFVFLREHDMCHDGNRYVYERAHIRRGDLWQPMINSEGPITIEYKRAI